MALKWRGCQARGDSADSVGQSFLEWRQAVGGVPEQLPAKIVEQDHEPDEFWVVFDAAAM
jgi:hypothetical protein